MRECFEEMAGGLSAGAVRSLGDGRWRVTIGGEDVTVVSGGEGGELVAVAVIGGYAGVSEKDLLLEDALKANCFWNETRGATLSVDPETGDLTLADRRDPDAFADGAALTAFLASFAAVARLWREYVANCTPEEARTEDETPSAEEVRFIP